MTATLSQLELSLWKGFKRQQAHCYESEFDCFYDFAQERLEFWSDLANKSRAMAIQQATVSVAPAAKPAGGNGGNGHQPCRDDRRDGCENCRAWNQPPSNDFLTFRTIVQLSSPKGPSSSLRDLVTLTLTLMLIITFPIGPQKSSSAPSLAERTP